MRAPAPTVSVDTPVPGSSAAIAGSFVLGAVHIEGARALQPAELARAFDPYLATTVDNSSLARIAADITRRYRDAGYILSYATVPPQTVQSGIVRIAVTEGYVGDIDIEGAGSVRTALLAMAEPLRGSAPLRTQGLERVLGLMRDLPGVVVSDVRLQRSADDPARHKLTIAVVRDRTAGLFYADNRGPNRDARARLYSSAGFASAVVPGDEWRTDLFAMPGDGYRFLYAQTAMSLPLGWEGLRLATSASLGDQRQDQAQGRLGGNSRNIAAQVTYPLLRSRAFSAAAKLAINDWHSTSRIGGLLFQRDDLTVARATLLFSSESATRFTAEIALARGLALGGTTRVGDPLSSNPSGGGHFTKASAQLQATRSLASRWTARVALAGQTSSAPLLAVEEIALGGAQIGRAFDYNSLTGDEGLGGSLEIVRSLGDIAGPFKRVELFGFVDGGAVYQANGSTSPLGGNTLASAGAGTRLALDRFNLSVEAAVPLKQAGNSGGVRGFLSLSRVF